MRLRYYSVERGITIYLWGPIPDRDNLYLITEVQVARKHRGKGYASAMLDEVCRDADTENVTLVLGVEPDGTADSLSEAELVAFYERKGFHSPSGNEGVMIREPKVQDEHQDRPSDERQEPRQVLGRQVRPG